MGGVSQAWRGDGASATAVGQVFGGSHSGERHNNPTSSSDRASIDRERDRPLAQIDSRVPSSCGVPQDRRSTSDGEDDARHVFKTWHSRGNDSKHYDGLTTVSYGARSAMERGV